MRFALHRRLALLALLAALACAAALAALLFGLRSDRDARVERERERLSVALEELLGSPEAPLPRRGGGGALRRPLQRGFADAQGTPEGPQPLAPFVRALLPALVAQAQGTPAGAPVCLERDAPRGALLLCAARASEGRYAFAAGVVGRQPGLLALRALMVALGLSVLLLVALAAHTMLAVRRDMAGLTGDLERLEGDLRAALSAAQVQEFDEVARRVGALARTLADAQERAARLAKDLAARERLASLGRVTAGLAHEVRNPLASIKLRAELAAEVPATPAEVREDLREIAAEVSRLDRLVADLLTVAGRRLGPRAPTELLALARSRCAQLGPEAQAAGVSLAVEGAALTLALDPDALTRALDNVLRNALQFSPRGETVRVRVERGPDGGALVEVSDAGPGVPREREGELFEPFFSTRPGGTGLGLAVSRAVLEAHGGSLRYARKGARSCFTLSLPAGESPPHG